jgi:hypothetical protein
MPWISKHVSRSSSITPARSLKQTFDNLNILSSVCPAVERAGDWIREKTNSPVPA